MDRESLTKRRQQAEAEFNELETQKAKIESRQAELRGQYQLLGEQLAALDKKKVSPKANTVDVTGVEGA